MKKSQKTALLMEEIIIHEKCFREGTIFSIIGWREINSKVYLVISKGSWEGLVNYDEFSLKIEKIDEK